MANIGTFNIEWLAENSEMDIQAGERVVVCDCDGRELARGELKDEASGWNRAASVNGFPVSTWLAIRNVECWTTNSMAEIVYVYREALENSETV